MRCSLSAVFLTGAVFGANLPVFGALTGFLVLFLPYNIKNAPIPMAPGSAIAGRAYFLAYFMNFSLPAFLWGCSVVVSENLSG